MFICFASSANEIVIREAVVIAAALACRSMPPRQPTGLTRGGGFVKSDNYLIACTCKLPLVFCLISCVVTLTCRFLSLSLSSYVSLALTSRSVDENSRNVSPSRRLRSKSRGSEPGSSGLPQISVSDYSAVSSRQVTCLSLSSFSCMSLSLSLSLSAESLVPQPRQLV